jgi:hypothetical protein
MADAVFRTFNMVLGSRGISARAVDDTLSETQYLNEENCEELAENAIGSRLGTSIINRTGTVIDALSGTVHSVSKLAGLNGSAWRYAGANGNLYRRTGLTQGAYNLLSGSLSGQPWQAVPAASTISAYPYIYIADANGMLKDNGSFATPQQMGLIQPQYPIQAQAQPPDVIALDNYVTDQEVYTYSGISGGSNIGYVSTTLTSPVTTPGIQAVTVADTTQPSLFQLLTIDTGGQQEVVLVIQVTLTGFVANFTKTHISGTSVTSAALNLSVPASAVATVSVPFSNLPCGALPVAGWPTTLQQADYIGLYLFVSDPTQVQSIQLAFDCGDGSFESDYFYKVIAQGPLQALLNTASSNSTAATTAATDALLDNSLGLFGTSSGSIVQLVTGLNNWNPLLIQLSDFAGAGRAAFSDPVFNWDAINSYQVTITMNDNSSATINLGALILFGGAGPDSFAGVAYDWLFTFYNNVDGTESNPCMVMSNVNPPNQTNWLLPRRQPCLLTMLYPTLDPQTTSLRIYRRGGTLGDEYRKVDEVLVTGSPQQYLDIAADDDIESSDIISFTNDVPVTSTLPVPVNTSLETAITTTNQVASVYPASMANISVSQQVDIGDIVVDSLTDTFETVIVLAVFSDHFTAYVQNQHSVGETVAATAKYVQPVTIMTEAYDQFWFAGDPNNPNNLYWSNKSNPQGVSSAAYVAVSTPDDPITAIVQFKGNLYVSTVKAWWSVAPGSNQSPSATVYPTACRQGCVAPFGYIVTEEAIYYQAIDGIRAFAGGASSYLTQDQEFIWQGIGTTPIVEADQTQFAQTRAAYWNSMLFWSYIGVDAKRHRVIFHREYKRWRNDDIDAQSLLLENDTNTLVFGDSNGLVHIDRVGSYDEGAVAGQLVSLPIAMNLQTPALNQGMPAETKQYQEFTLDCNTNGQPVTVTLIFNDGEFSEVIGTVTTSERERINLTLNDGDGYTAYKVSLQLTASALTPIYIYQAAIRALMLAKTRQSLDTYQLKMSIENSKLCKQIFVEYTANADIAGVISYDDPCWPDFTFTLPANGGVRNPMRLRLPAVKFRFLRCILTSSEDFQIWTDSTFEVKPLCSGKSYGAYPLLNVEA